MFTDTNIQDPVAPGGTVEICYKKMDDQVSVHYRREAGTPEAEDLINQVKEHQALLGEAARYFYRIV